MKSLYNPTDNQELIDRFQQLRPDSPALWGKMNVSQMLAHCQVPLQTAYGDIKLKRSFFGWLFGNIAKKKLTSGKPWDKSLPTDPAFVMKGDHDFETEKNKLIPLIQRFSKVGPDGITKDQHPFFGKLTSEEWDRLQWNHLNHHLGQFGV